jgi:diacylglycerol kinase (ATP)
MNIRIVKNTAGLLYIRTDHMTTKPPSKTGLARITAAFFHSMDGLRFAILNEAAFRQELALYAILLVVLYFLPVSALFKSVLFLANTIVLVTELLNSAIESIVDMVSPEYHDLAKRAKDLGSGGVLVSLILAAALWSAAILWILTDGG